MLKYIETSKKGPPDLRFPRFYELLTTGRMVFNKIQTS